MKSLDAYSITKHRSSSCNSSNLVKINLTGRYLNATSHKRTGYLHFSCKNFKFQARVRFSYFFGRRRKALLHYMIGVHVT